MQNGDNELKRPLVDVKPAEMDGPPAKRRRNDSPAMSSLESNQDLAWNLLEFNSELPDELNCQPVSRNKKAEDTIQKNHNLSQLLSSHNDLPGPISANAMNFPLNPRSAALNPQHLRQQMYASQLQHQSGSVASMSRPGFPQNPNAHYMHGMTNMFGQNQVNPGFGPRQGSYGNVRPPMMSGGSYFANNPRNLNGTVYPHGNEHVAMASGNEFCNSQFSTVGDGSEMLYSNRMAMGNKMSAQMNGAAIHRQCDSVKSAMTPSSVMANCQPPFSSADASLVMSKSSNNTSTTPRPTVVSPNAGMFPVSSAVSTTDASDTAPVVSQIMNRRSELQNQIILVMHAHKCMQLSKANGTTKPCTIPECPQLKNTLKHMKECNDKKTCKVPMCVELRQAIIHYMNCQQPTCFVCSPVRKKYNSAQPNQPKTPVTMASIAMDPNSSSKPPILDATDAVQAHKMLGVDPRDHANPMLPAASLLSNSDQPSSAPGVVTPTTSSNHKASPNVDLANSFGLPSTPAGAKPVKQWHLTVSQNLRDQLVQKLVQAIFPSPPDPNFIKPEQMSNLIKYAKKVEGDMFDKTNSVEEYCQLLMEKIQKIQRELEEKRMRRMMDNGSTAVPVSMPGMPLHANSALHPRMQQPNDGRLDAYNDGLPTMHHAAAVARCPPMQFMNNSFPQNMYNSQMMRQQSSSSVGFQDVHSSAGQMYRPMSADGFCSQNLPNFPNSKHDLPFVQQELVCSSGQTAASKLMISPQASQPRQAQSLSNTTPVNVAFSESQSPYCHLNGPSPGNGQQMSQVPTLMQQPNTASPFGFQVNGVQTPAPPSCHAQLTSPAGGNFKMAVKHEDITDDEVTVKSEPRSPEDFKYSQAPVHEDITDDEVEMVKVEEPVADVKAHVELKPEEVKVEPVTAVEPVPELEPEAKMDTSDVVPKEELDVKQEDVKCEEMPAQESEALPPPEEAPKGPKVWKPEELQNALLPVFEQLYWLDEASWFREPVDAVALNIPDYYEVIKRPMDLSTIRTKLNNGDYSGPWEFIDDIYLMFDNAWLYNRKGTKAYKCCSKLAEVFEANIDAVMQSMGFCCGHRFVFSPQVLCCIGKQLCVIPRDSPYYNYQDRYLYCEKCFLDLPGDEIEMADDATQPGLKIKKEQFAKEKNDKLEYEIFVECKECHRKMHKICVLQMEQIWPEGFVCNGCLRDEKRRENRYTSKRLPETNLSRYLEMRVNQYLKKKDAGAGDVTIRVMSSYDKTVEVRPGMKARYVSSGEMPESFPYRVKAMFAFEEVDGVEVCFFGMHVQEYGSDCPKTNAKRVYIAYLDSVHYFQPRQFRTQVYHEILIGYLDYAKSLGYQFAHIWACPPSEGDDYIFHCHPPDQKIPKPKRLQEWYKKMLDKAVTDRVVCDYKDILKDALENGVADVTDLPYFEGDYWPNVIEDCIKELDREELEKRRREEEEAAADSMIDFEPSSGDSVELQTLTGKKKGQKSGNTKKKNTKSKKPVNRKSKLGLSHGGNDLFDKVLANMDKHKEVFFVIRLHSSTEPIEIRDPDPLINCDLMDGRDAFLTLARDKHYEFSSLRRAKYATMGMLYELHVQGKDGFVYSCNDCKANVEIRYHCGVCDDFDLCIPCYKKSDHVHKTSMNKLGLDDNNKSNSATKSQSPEESRRKSLQLAFEHAYQCRDANCRSHVCLKMKGYISHLASCQKGCKTCKAVLQLCYTHAKTCKETRCLVPSCSKWKLKFQKMQAEQQMLVRRRMALMQRGLEDDSVSETTPNSPPPSVGASNGVASYSGGGGKAIHEMAPTPPPAALMAARQAEQTAQRQAGAMSMSGYPMSDAMGMHPHQRQMMMMMPNQMPNSHQFDPQGMYPGGGGVPMSMQEDAIYQQQQYQHSVNLQGQHVMDAMSMQQQQQMQHPMSATSKQFEMVVSKIRSHPSQQQNPEVVSMLKQNPQLMASLIKQTHSQQPSSSGGHALPPSVNPTGHMMEGMIDDPGGTMCNMPPGMQMTGMMPGQGPMMTDAMMSGQGPMPSQWQTQPHLMRPSMHADYGQPFPHHMGGRAYAGGNVPPGAPLIHMQRMRANYRGGVPVHPQSPYVSDDPYAASHLQPSQEQMQLMMQRRRLQSARPRMDVGNMGQPMMHGLPQQRYPSSMSHASVDMPPQSPVFPSMPSSSALSAQPGVRTHSALGKMGALPRRPPPHYSDTLLLPQGGVGLNVQRTGNVPMGLSGVTVRTEMNASSSATDDTRVRFPHGPTTDYGNAGVRTSIDGLQYPKNNITP